MNNKYYKLKPSEEFLNKINSSNYEIKYINLFSEKKVIELMINIINFKALDDIQKLKQSMSSKFGNNLDIKINYSFNDKLDDEVTHEELLKFVIESYKNESVRHQVLFSRYELQYINNKMYIKFPTESLIEQAENSQVKNDLKNKIIELTQKDLNIEFTAGEFNDLIEKINEKTEETVKNANIEPSQSMSPQPVKSKYPKRRKKITNAEQHNIVDLENSLLNNGVTIEGEIFVLNIRNTKNNKCIIEVMITDYTDSIVCKMFLSGRDNFKLKVGSWASVTGNYEYDEFSHENVIIIQDIEEIESKSIKREDNSENKRVELHTHTNMSEMSGAVSVGDLIKKAKAFGHKAIAITDFAVVHSFPFAYKEASDDFKIIFGVEAYMVDDEQEMITKPKDIMIEEEIYVVFDLETTGLDPHSDKIIEIGAVKLKGKTIVDEFSMFVNPEREIPLEIQQLTSITNDMVKDAPKIEEVLPKFIEFCKGNTVVAHNAKFDVGFINQKSKVMDLDFSPSVIDTLHWARVLLKDVKRFGLKNIVNYFNLKLENHHRAVDDAKATAEIFQKLLNMVLGKGVLKLTEINTEIQTNIENAETLNTIILVKNQKGLKSLYELVSEAHINYFGNRKPRIPKTLLEKNRENLIIASSASAVFQNNGELANMYIRGLASEEIEERIKFYDYIEIHPVDNYTDLISGGEIDSKEKIIEMNKYFIEIAKKLGKLVVATGDVHYLEEKESIGRSVLILGSGMGRRIYQYDKKLYLKTTDEMLKEFSYLDKETAQEVVIENTNKIADMIEHVQPIPDGFYPPAIDGAEEQVRQMTYEKAYELYGKVLPTNLEERIEKELNSIINNGFAVLYLIAQKLVKKSLDNGYLVGSRGSVGSSIVAYLMGITEVNGLYPHYRCPSCKKLEFTELEGSGVDLEDKVCPDCGTKYIKDGHAIPFEVFMGFDGDKVPDIDLNFSGEYQAEIHKYTEELFGAENVFRAGTISTLAEKNAFGYVKKYFEETGEEKSKAEVTRIAKLCEGARKTTGQHPGGMIVLPSNKSIYDFTPIQRPANDMKAESITTHFDYHVMDEQLVKLDILGHDDPTTLKILENLTGLNIYDIPLDDKKVLSLFSSTEALGVTSQQIESPIGTSGVPEFGTSFVKQMLIDTKPTTFSELVRISGLSHGTDVWLNNAQEYVRNGQATLGEIISVRDDIMNYLIDNKVEKSLAFNIMEFVRKGQPTKNKEKWKEYAGIMKEHGIKDWYIESCEKIKYMFPKGHAVAYVMMAVRIAYFKVHYPLEFYTAYLNRKIDNFNISRMFKPVDELVRLKKELVRNTNSMNAKEKQEYALYEILIEMHYRGIELEQMDIYKSTVRDFFIDNGKIVLPLIAMDQLGESVANNIIAERELGEFLSIEDLVKRTKVNKTVVDLLKFYKCLPELSETNQKTLF